MRGGFLILLLSGCGQRSEFLCEGERFALGSSRYCLYTTGTSWRDAEAQCRQRGGHLLALNGEEESRAIIKRLTEFKGISEKLWIGLSDAEQEGRWRWSSAEPVRFTRWDKGEPNDTDGREDCADWRISDGVWNDVPCNAKIHYICEG